MSRKVLVERITARVFCHPNCGSQVGGRGGGGGNPVTVFLPERRMKQSVYQSLATQCSWESVIIEPPTAGGITCDYSRMSFYMPSGLQVSYCAHAAIGGAFVAAVRNDYRSTGTVFMEREGKDDNTGATETERLPREEDEIRTSTQRIFSFIPNMLPDEVHTVNVDVIDDAACLSMRNTIFDDKQASDPMLLMKVLDDHLDVSKEILKNKNQSDEDETKSDASASTPPTFRNVSVVRPKTLVFIPKLDDLRNNISIPPVSSPPPSPSEPAPSPTSGSDIANLRNQSFEEACGSIDHSTGLYLYSKLEDCDLEENGDSNDGDTFSLSSLVSSWEARQFPRASGYPEDPATGIAAAALAACLAKNYYYSADAKGKVDETIKVTSRKTPNFNIYQGMSMDRPSLIQVVDLHFENEEKTIVSFGLKGTVMIDEKESLELCIAGEEDSGKNV